MKQKCVLLENYRTWCFSTLEWFREVQFPCIEMTYFNFVTFSRPFPWQISPLPKCNSLTIVSRPQNDSKKYNFHALIGLVVILRPFPGLFPDKYRPSPNVIALPKKLFKNCSTYTECLKKTQRNDCNHQMYFDIFVMKLS